MNSLIFGAACKSEKAPMPAATRLLSGCSRRSGLLILLALGGCAGQPQPEIRHIRVEVPVQVPCRAPEVPVPAWATASLKKSDTPEAKVLALLAERRQRIGYEKQLEAAASACR